MSKNRGRILQKYSDEVIQAAIDESKKETQVLEMVMKGASFPEISKIWGKKVTVTNTMIQTRLRRAQKLLNIPREDLQQVPFNREEEICHEMPYPDNLVFAIFGRAPDAGWPIDYKEGLQYVLTLLTPREQEMLKCIYEDDMTLTDTAKQIGVSPERIRQQHEKSLRRLKTVDKARYILRGYAVEHAKDEYDRQLMEKTQEAMLADLKLQFTQDELTAICQRYAASHAPTPLAETPLEMMGLPVRVYNALHFRGYRTFADILKTPIADLRRIRNIGTDSIDSLLQYMEDQLKQIILPLEDPEEGEEV